MKINTLNKTLLAAFMAVTLAACTNTNTPQSSVAANASTSSEVVEQSSDIIDESIKEDSEKNKPADEEISVEKEKSNSEDDKEEAKANDTTIDVEKKADENTSSEENTKTRENEANSPSKEESTKEDIDYQEREGTYISNLIASKNGDRDPQMGLTSLSNLSISDNTLSLEGTIDYFKNPDSYDNSEEYDKDTYNFKITTDTKFQAVGGMADPEIFTPEEFVEYYQGVKDSGLALKIDVKDGVATIVSIAS